MRTGAAWLIAGALFLAAPLAARGIELRTPEPPGEEPTEYLAGGRQPWPGELKRQLDEHAGILSLGINIDWLHDTGIDPAPFVEAIAAAGEAVRSGRVPGAIIHVGRINGKTMPIAVGHGMVDPQKRELTYSTRYSLHDLTGPLVMVPLTYLAVMDGRLALADPVANHLLELEETSLGAVTISQLLQHGSGLPSTWPEEPPLDGREEVLRALAQWQDAAAAGGEEAKPSALNYALLGLVLVEAAGGESLPEQMARLLAGAGHAGVEDREFGYHVDTRARIAPGQYSERLGRMVWAEPEEPVAEALAPGAGHWGLIASASALEPVLLRYLVASALFRGWAARGAIPIAGDPPDGAARWMGGGVMAGRFGEESFGWDSPHGSSIWLLPEERAFIIYLSNPDHPDGLDPEAEDPREAVLPLLARSLGWRGNGSGEVQEASGGGEQFRDTANPGTGAP